MYQWRCFRMSCVGTELPLYVRATYEREPSDAVTQRACCRTTASPFLSGPTMPSRKGSSSARRHAGLTLKSASAEVRGGAAG